MFRKLFKKNILLVIFLIPLLNSCVRKVSNKGNEFVDENVLKPITSIISAKEGVLPKNYMMEKWLICY